MRRRQWRYVLAVLAAATLAADTAQAGEPTAEDRERARALLFDGRSKLQSGEAATAVKSFQAAHAIMNVPTTGLDLVKGLIAMGRLIEARTVALEVTRLPQEPNEPAAYTRARAAAAQAVADLAARIPALVIHVAGPPAAAAQVMVDGTPVPAAALDLPWKVDPGEHVIAAVAAGFRVERRTVRLQEGETLPVQLTLVSEQASLGGSDPAHATPRAGHGEGRSPAAASADGARGPQEDGGRRVPSWAWVSGGMGLVALGVGTAFAVDYVAVRSTVAEDCPKNLCNFDRYDVASADALEGRWNRSLGLAVGLGAASLVGVGAAVYGIVMAPAERPSDTAKREDPGLNCAPWISAGSAGASLWGRF